MWWCLALAMSAKAGILPFEVSSKTLDNGLTVHVIPMDSPDVVAYYTWMKVGSRDEVDEGRTGFAHFFEHLMFKGTKEMGPAERERAILRLGMEENAYTNDNETVYNGVLPADGLERYIALQADQFQNLHLTEDMVQRESGAVYGEFRKSQADPFGSLYDKIVAAAFTEHTYGHSTLGYEADIAQMPTAHEYALQFFDRYYRPEFATILVVGDADPDKTFALIDKAYGDWEPAAEAPPEIPVEPEQTEMRRVDATWDSPTAARLVMAWKIPGHSNDDPEVAHLELVSNLLMATVGRLQSRLVREEAIAFRTFGWRGDGVDPDLFQVWVTLKDPSSIDEAESIIREEVAAIVAGVDQDVLDNTRSYERYRFLTGLEDPGTVARTLGMVLRRDPSVDAIDRFYAHFDAATPEQVGAAAAKFLVDEKLTIATLVHTPETEAE